MGVKLQSFPDRASCVEASQQYLSSPCEVEIEKKTQEVVRYQKLFPPNPISARLRISCFTDLELSINTLGVVRLAFKLPTQHISIKHCQLHGSSKQRLFDAVVKVDQLRIKNLSYYDLQINGTVIGPNETRGFFQLDDIPLITLTEASKEAFIEKNGYHPSKDVAQAKYSLSKLIRLANLPSSIRLFESEKALQQELENLRCNVIIEEHVRTNITSEASELTLSALIPEESSREIIISAESIKNDRKNIPEMTFYIESVLQGRSVWVIHQAHRFPIKTYIRRELLFQGVYPSERVKISNQIGYPLLIEQNELLSGEAQEFAYTPSFSIEFSSELQERISATWHKVIMNLEDLPCKDYRIQDVFMTKSEIENHLLKKPTIKLIFYFLKHGKELIECRQNTIMFICKEHITFKLGQAPLFRREKGEILRRSFLEKGLTIDGKELFAPNKIEQEAPDSPREEYAEVVMEDDELFSPRIDLLQDASSAQQESHSHIDHPEDGDQKSG